MCTGSSIAQLLVAVALVGSIAACLVTAARVRERLETSHPGTWRWLGQWEIRWPDGEVQEAALPEFLWSGMYRALEDPQLNRAALHAKLAGVACLVTTLALIALSSFFPVSGLLGCLVP